MSDSYSNPGAQVQKITERAGGQVGGAAEKAAATARELAQRGRSFVSASPRRLTAAVQRNPWIAVLVGVAAGFCLAHGLRSASRS